MNLLVASQGGWRDISAQHLHSMPGGAMPVWGMSWHQCPSHMHATVATAVCRTSVDISEAE